jgi:uncharacterized membrane protein YkgB
MGAGLRIQAAGGLVLRYGLVLVVGWFDLMKFTEYEAKGIEPLVVHSPFMSWTYNFLSVPTFSGALGVIEVSVAILMGLRHWSAVGSAGAVIMFVTTLSFLFSTPRAGLGGFPSLSALPGQFLLKTWYGWERHSGRLVSRGLAAELDGQHKVHGNCAGAFRD